MLVGRSGPVELLVVCLLHRVNVTLGIIDWAVAEQLVLHLPSRQRGTTRLSHQHSDSRRRKEHTPGPALASPR
jgi:hypothetical protein